MLYRYIEKGLGEEVYKEEVLNKIGVDLECEIALYAVTFDSGEEPLTEEQEAALDAYMDEKNYKKRTLI
jgi:hypothetical protein